MEITTARPEEIEEVWEFIDTAFGFVPNHFQDRLGWQWKPECVDWDGVFVVRDETGRIASLVRLWEMHLIQNGRSVVCGGIGSVSTGAHARGQGGMTALMEHCAAEIKRRGYPLAILGGDRFRYASFGYESAGRTMNHTVSARGLRRNGIEPIEPLEFDESVREHIEATRALMPYTVQRRPCEEKRMYACTGREVLAAGDEDFGFLVLGKDRVWEWGGHIETVLRLAAYAIREEITTTVNLALPYSTPAPEQLHKAMSNWSVTPTMRAVIYDLEKTLQAFDAQQYGQELLKLDPCEQVWHLFGKPDAPRNLWIFPIDLV